jgi:hypothetical protein
VVKKAQPRQKRSGSDLRSRRPLSASLPPRALRLVTQWALMHEAELRSNWDLAQALELLVPIEPLRDLDYFRQVRVDDEARTIVWPNGLDPDPNMLHKHYGIVESRSAHASQSF